MKRKTLIALIMMLLVAVTGSAVYVFKVLDTTSGLTCSQINWITKDSRGYMWFGTPAGLFRYDGYVFKKFQSDSNDGNSLPDSYIKRMYEGLNGQLWIETAQGICVYHPQTETFDRDQKSIFDRIGVPGIAETIFISPEKDLWMYVPGRGVYAYNMTQQLLYSFLYNDDHPLPKGHIIGMNNCREGVAMVCDNGTIICLSIKNGKQRIVWVNDGMKRQVPNSSLRVFADSHNDLWLFGQSTLAHYSNRTRQWDTNVAERLGMKSSNLDLHVFDMQEDRDDNLWIGTDQLGLQRLDMTTGEIELVQPISLRMRDPVGGPIRVMSVFVDNTGLLWVGTQRRGVSYWGKNIYKFVEDRVCDVTVLCEDKSGKIWYCTADHGILDHPEMPLISQYITSMVIGDDGTFWIGSRDMGLTRIKDGVPTYYNTVRDGRHTIINDCVQALCKDKRGNIWIATEGGLQVFSVTTNQFATYTRENGKLGTNNITALFNTTDNQMLIGTADGLDIMNPNDGKIEHLVGNRSSMKRFTNNYITQVYEDSRKFLWIGTRDGLNVLNTTDDELIYITEQEGLCSNNVNGITEDKNGNIWVTTSNGASRIVVERGNKEVSLGYTIYNYDTTDGLQSNEFGDGACITTRDGRVLIGGKYGSAWVIDNGKEGVQTLDKVILSQLFIGEEEVQIGHRYDHNTILTQSLNESRSIKLNNNQNTFTIKFAVGNYNQSERLQFIYWMQGLDDEWHNGDPIRHGVMFENLPAGKYTLHVKAVSADGAVSAEETTIDITIASPWWYSWRMIVVYIIVLFILWCLWRFGFRKFREVFRRQRGIMEELKNQREETKQAGQELRQPMVRMTNIITSLSEREYDMKGRELLNSLHYELLQLITRVSEMQITLDDPMQKAEKHVDTALTFDDEGNLKIRGVSDHFSYSSRLGIKDLKTRAFHIAFIAANEQFRDFITQRLKDIYQLSVFASCEELLDTIDTDGLHAVVCEQDLAGMSGSELCEVLKGRGCDAKFILVTEQPLTPQDIRLHNITINADDYLSKPFNINEAMNRINKLLDIELDMTKILSDSIKGDKKLLQQENASMTTSAMNYDLVTHQHDNAIETVEAEQVDDENKASRPVIEMDSTDLLIERVVGSDYRYFEQPDRQLLRDIDQYVVQNMIRGQIDLNILSRTFNISRIDLFHRVQNLTGGSPAEFVRDLRMQHACDLLVRTDINISDVAINTGFVTADNFSGFFREKMGMTPMEYRYRNK